MSKENTLILYIFIFIFTTLIAVLSQHKMRNTMNSRPAGLAISFLVHWFFCCFTNIGVDYQNYYRIIEYLGTSSAFEGVELGFTWFCLALKWLHLNPDQIIFILKTITVILFYRGFYKIKNVTVLPLVILAYNALIYLQGFYLLSMQLAIALLFLSSINFLFGDRKKTIRYFILGCLIHTSSVLVAPIVIILLYLQKKQQTITKKQIVFLVGVMIVVVVSFSIIYDYAISSIPLFQFYAAYELVDASQSTGSGLGQIFFYLPIFYFVLQIYNSNLSLDIKNASVVFSIVGFSYAMLGYKVDVLMRINESFFCIYALFIPLLFCKRKLRLIAIKQIRFPYSMETLVWVVYLIFRGYIVTAGYMSDDSLSEISEYNFFIPF